MPAPQWAQGVYSSGATGLTSGSPSPSASSDPATAVSSGAQPQATYTQPCWGQTSFSPGDAAPEPAAGASNTTVVALSAADATVSIQATLVLARSIAHGAEGEGVRTCFVGTWLCTGRSRTRANESLGHCTTPTHERQTCSHWGCEATIATWRCKQHLFGHGLGPQLHITANI